MIARRPLLREAASDAELMERIAAGDLGALGALYDRHQAPVRRFVARALPNGASEVDDIVHTAFLTAAKIASRYDGHASCRPWLIGIAVKLLHRRGSALQRFLAMARSFASTPAIDPRATIDARRDLERALASLSDAKRVTLVMAEVEGMTCPEIAEALEIPIGTVWTRLHAARQELRAYLEGGA